jgi:hypothetical protein
MLSTPSISELEAAAALSASLFSALLDCESDDEISALIDEECDKAVRRGLISPLSASAISDVLLNG